MPLAIGTRLGAYEIVGSLGVGGMGEVYRARDTKLGREVAVKIVLEAYTSDRERIVRLEREAMALAALNHPHIATLHGLEEVDGRHFLVMELVEGQTLAEVMLAQGAGLPVAQALSIGGQIAEALEAAHEKGIIHRDLKPANVKITPDEQVKVLDFGLAKAMDGSSAGASVANSPTISIMATQAGVILGTASYMSPEQAKGFPADHRADVFSFGVVLYEMLTGRQPFQGETVSDVLASVLIRDPDLGALPQALHPRVIDLVRRCLEKQPRRRWQAIGDVRYEIEAIAASPLAPEVAAALPVASSAPPRPLWKRAVVPAVVAIVASAVTGVLVWRARPQPAPGVVMRFPIGLGEGQSITLLRGATAVSPDGSRVAYIANRQLYLRTMSEVSARRVFDNDGLPNIGSLAFSPDSQQIVFWTGGDQQIKRLAVTGGAPASICKTEDFPTGITWSGDSLLFSTTDRIWRVAATGGQPEVLIQLEPNQSAYRPQLLPDGHTVLFSLATGSGTDRWEKAQIVAQAIGSKTRTVLVEGGNDARYVPSGFGSPTRPEREVGHLVYVLGGVLFAVRVDVAGVRVSGGPVSVVEGVRRGAGEVAAGAALFSVSDNGTLVYLPGPVNSTAQAQLHLALFDRGGTPDPLKVPPGPYSEPRMSPDGKQIAFGSDDGRDVSIWVHSIAAGGAARPLTFGGRNRYPVWSPDSTRVAFQSDREGDLGVFWQRADGTGTADRLTTPATDVTHVPQSFSPDGSVLLLDATTASKVSLLRLTMRDKSTAPVEGVESVVPTGAAFSRDGRWMAYTVRSGSNTSSRVFVQPNPPTGALFQVSRNTEDGHHAVWSPDGAFLFYTPGPGARLFGVPVTTRPSFAPGEPVMITRPFTNASPSYQRPYDVSPDGRRFLGLTATVRSNAAAGDASEIYVVANWFEELRQRVPGR